MQKDKQMVKKIKHWLERGTYPIVLFYNVKKYIINNQDEKVFILTGYPLILGKRKN
jgi:hypothetical protein